jgi:hypothetical protein
VGKSSERVRLLVLFFGVLDEEGSDCIGEFRDFSTSRKEKMLEAGVDEAEEGSAIAGVAAGVVAGAGLAELGVVEVVVVLYSWNIKE